MKFFNLIFILSIICIITSCGKVGPLNLPEDKIDKSVITYPCHAACQKKIEEEKKRQQSVILQSD